MNLDQVVSFIRERREQKLPLEVVFLERPAWMGLVAEIDALKISRNVDDFGKEILLNPADIEDVKVLGVPIRIFGEPIPE